jgi:hypothetical protein
MYARMRRTLGALSRDISGIRGDWRRFAAGMAAEAAFITLIAVLSLLSVELIKWMGP